MTTWSSQAELIMSMRSILDITQTGTGLKFTSTEANNMEQIKMKRGATIVCTELYETDTHKVVIVDKVFGGIGGKKNHDWEKGDKVHLPLSEIIAEPQVTATTEINAIAA